MLDLKPIEEIIWNQLSRARTFLDGQDGPMDCKNETPIIYSTIPLCPQPDMVPTSPLDNPGSNDMFVVAKDTAPWAKGTKIITVDNTASRWTFSPNSMDSGKTIQWKTYFEGEEKILRVRQSCLKPKKGAPAPPDVAIWMYNRVVPDGRNDPKIEDDLWIGMVKKKQSSTKHSDIVTIDAPRKRFNLQPPLHPPTPICQYSHSLCPLYRRSTPSNPASAPYQ